MTPSRLRLEETRHAARIVKYKQTQRIEDAVEAGIEAAATWVSEGTERFLVRHRGWSEKELQIAERAARAAIAALQQFEVDGR